MVTHCLESPHNYLGMYLLALTREAKRFNRFLVNYFTSVVGCGVFKFSWELAHPLQTPLISVHFLFFLNSPGNPPIALSLLLHSQPVLTRCSQFFRLMPVRADSGSSGQSSFTAPVGF